MISRFGNTAVNELERDGVIVVDDHQCHLAAYRPKTAANFVRQFRQYFEYDNNSDFDEALEATGGVIDEAKFRKVWRQLEDFSIN